MTDVTIEYVLGDEKFTCTAWFDGKAEPACVVDFSYMGDMENSILDKVGTKPKPKINQNFRNTWSPPDMKTIASSSIINVQKIHPRPSKPSESNVVEDAIRSALVMKLMASPCLAFSQSARRPSLNDSK